MTEYREPEVPVDSVSPADLSRAIDAGEPVRLLDVRNRDEVDEWRIDGPSVERTTIPYMKWLQADVRDTVADRAAEIPGEGPVTVVCARGEASAYVAGLLTQQGVEARNLADGMDGWAHVYEVTEVAHDGAATVLQYRRPSSGCLGYLLVGDGEAAVVDPLRAFADRYAAAAAEYGATLRYAIDTHVHADHLSGLTDVAAASDAEPLLSRRAIDRGMAAEVTPIEDGDVLSLGDREVRVVALPGHTTGMTGLAVEDVLLTGDSLFLDSVARPDLEDGDAGAPDAARELHHTLTERLANFDAETTIAPGHFAEGTDRNDDGTYTATLGEIRARVDAFDSDREAFVERVCADMPPRPANFERIIAVNLGRESADAEEALELELGPNNCAASAD